MNLQQWQTELQKRIACRKAPKRGDALGLAIYHNAYRCRLKDTLAQTYERVFKWMGPHLFEDCANEFIENHSSEHHSLNHYGDHFSHWLDSQGQPMAAELAKVDWAMHVCFTGLDADPLDPIDLAPLQESDWENVIFHAVPTACLILSTKQAFTQWTSLEKGEPITSSQRFQPRPQAIFVWRKGLNPMMRALGPHQAWATEKLLEGVAFSEICNHLSHISVEDAERLAGQLLSQWLMDGALKGFQLGHDAAD